MLRLIATPILALTLAWPLFAPAHNDGHTSQKAATQPSSAVPLYDNLGKHHYRITTRLPRAQR